MATVCPSSFTSLSSIATAGELSGASLIQVCGQKNSVFQLALDRHYKKYIYTSFFLLLRQVLYYFFFYLHAVATPFPPPVRYDLLPRVPQEIRTNPQRQITVYITSIMGTMSICMSIKRALSVLTERHSKALCRIK